MWANTINIGIPCYKKKWDQSNPSVQRKNKYRYLISNEHVTKLWSPQTAYSKVVSFVFDFYSYHLTFTQMWQTVPRQDDSMARLNRLTPFENLLWVSTAQPNKLWIGSRSWHMWRTRSAHRQKMTDRSTSMEVMGGVACWAASYRNWRIADTQ